MTNWDMAALILIYILSSLALINFIIKLVKKEKFNTKDAVFPFGVAALIILFVLALAFRQSIEAEEGQITDWIQIFLTLGLVVVTGAYAWSAHRQAKEMQNQRYDIFRPVLDILIDTKIEPAVNTDARKITLTYHIHNVGVGPALDGYISTPEHNISYLGTLTTIHDYKATTGDYSSSYVNHINIEKDKLPAIMIIAYYKDVYGRYFESKREIILADDKENVYLSALKHRKLDRNRDKDLIIKIWSPSKEEVTLND